MRAAFQQERTNGAIPIVAGLRYFTVFATKRSFLTAAPGHWHNGANWPLELFRTAALAVRHREVSGVKDLRVRSFKPRPLPTRSVSFKFGRLSAQPLVRTPAHTE